MSERKIEISDGAVAMAEKATAPTLQSPPVAAVPEKREADPAARLHELARELVRTRNRRVMMEYLRLRRAMR